MLGFIVQKPGNGEITTDYRGREGKPPMASETSPAVLGLGAFLGIIGIAVLVMLVAWWYAR